MKRQLLSGPYLIWMGLFTVIPLVIVLYYAFTDSITGAFTLKNIASLGTYLPIFLRSVWLSLVSALICLVVGSPVAWTIAQAKPGHQRFFYLLVMLPMCISFLLRTLAWVSLLEDTGIINRLLGNLGVGPLKLMRNNGAVILGMVYNYLPYMIMPLYTVIMKIDPRLVEVRISGVVGIMDMRVLHGLDAPARQDHEIAVRVQLIVHALDVFPLQGIVLDVKYPRRRIEQLERLNSAVCRLDRIDALVDQQGEAPGAAEPQPLRRLAQVRRDAGDPGLHAADHDRRDEHDLRQDHEAHGEEQVQPPEGPDAGEEQIEQQPADHRRQAHQRAVEHQQRPPPGEAPGPVKDPEGHAEQQREHRAGQAHPRRGGEDIQKLRVGRADQPDRPLQRSAHGSQSFSGIVRPASAGAAGPG